MPLGIPGGIGGPDPHPEGSGFSHNTGAAMGDRHILSPMLFGPGSGASGSLVQANKVQKHVMDHKFDGTEEYNPYDMVQRAKYLKYDSDPEVQKKRWEELRWSAKLMLWRPDLNDKIFWTWNAGVALVTLRLYTSSVKNSMRMWAFFAGCGYLTLHGIELA